MDLISTGGTYALLLLFGAFAVAVHGFNQFDIALPGTSTDRVGRLLDTVALTYRGGPSSYNKGLLCYIAISEFLYLVLSSSSVILDMSLSVVGQAGSVGALSTSASELNPLTPILASSVIMTIGQIKPFSQIENAIRRISHHFAGIPHGVYEMLDRVNDFLFEPADEHPESGAVTVARQTAVKVAEAAGRAGMDALELEDFEQNVLKLYTLKSWTIGQSGERLWAARNRNALAGTVALISPGLQIFDVALKEQLADAGGIKTAPQLAPADSDTATTLARPTSTGQHLERWLQLAREASELKKSLSMLLAVLAINQPGARAPRNAPQIQALLDHIKQRKSSRETNALAASTVLGLLAAFVLVFVYYCLADTADDFATFLFAIAVQSGADAPEAPPVDAFVVMQTSIGKSLLDVFDFGLMFVIAAAVALSVRATRIAGHQWDTWTNAESPFRQYASVALMASLIAFLIFTLVSFSRLVVYPSMTLQGNLMSASLLNDFRWQYPQYFFMPLVGILSAWAVCFLSDRLSEGQSSVRSGSPNSVTQTAVQHDERGLLRRALPFAALCAIAHTVFRIGTGNLDELSGTVDALMVPGLVYLTLFYLYGVFHARGRRPDHD